MPWNVFVLGLDPLGERLLPRLRHAGDYAIHPLLPLDTAVHASEYDVDALVQRAGRELEAFNGRVDAVVGYWDFPSTALLPLLRAPLGLRGPSLDAVLKCAHKYWSRLEQVRCVPDVVPPFQALDPFADDPLATLRLAYPFWLKPVTAHSSQLGYRIEGPAALRRVLPLVRQAIGRLGRPLARITARAELPAEVVAVTGHHCIAEAIISAGRQCTLEGYARGGEVHVYGVVDTVRDRRHRSVLVRYVYPSRVPEPVQQRMVAIAARFIGHIGYDDAPFNMEFFYDGQRDRVWLLEVNARLSRSHAALFDLVDGAPHFQVMIDTALGLAPRLPRRQGRYRLAAKEMIRTFRDGIVRQVPSPAQVRAVEARFPDTQVQVNVSPGTRLATLLHQDPHSFELAVLFVGGMTERGLSDRIRRSRAMLPFRIDPPDTRVAS